MFSWHIVPFARLLIPLIIGIQLHEFFPKTQFAFSLLAVVCALVLTGFLFLKPEIKHRYQTIWGIHFTLAAIASGALLAFMNEAGNLPWHYSKIRNPEAFIVRISDDVSEKKKYYQFYATVESCVSKQGESINCCGNVLIRYHKTEGGIKPKNGEKLIIHSDLIPVPPPDNPDQFDYQKFLKRIGILHTININERNSERLNKPTFSLYAIASQYKTDCIEIIRKYIPDSRNSGVAEALLLGYKDDLDPQITEGFAKTGTLHVLAVSGLHAAMIYAILGFLTGFLKRYRYGLAIQTCLILSGLWLYCFMTGLSSSVVRSGVMFTILAIAPILKRKQNIFNTVYASALIMLIYQPNYLYEAGFQLSYAAVLGIILLYKRLSRLFISKNKIIKFMYETTCVTLAAQAFTLPLSLYYFNQFPTYFLVTNLIIIPIFTLILILLLVLIPLSVFGSLAALLGELLFRLIDWSNLFMEWTSTWPLQVIEGLYLSKLNTGHLFLIIFISISFVIHRKKWQLFTCLSLVLSYCSFNTYRILHQQDQRLMAFHSFGSHNVFTCIDGKSAYILSDSAFLDDENIKKKLGRFLCRFGITKIHEVNERENFISTHFYFISKTGFQFFDKTMTIRNSRHLGVQKDDFYLLNGSEKNMNDLLSNNFNKLIISSKIKYWKFKKWNSEYFKQQSSEINLFSKFRLIEIK